MGNRAGRDDPSEVPGGADRLCAGRHRSGSAGVGSGRPLSFGHEKGETVIPPPVHTLSPAGVMSCVFFILLVPLAAAGISLVNTGLGRSRSAAHAMVASL